MKEKKNDFGYLAVNKAISELGKLLGRKRFVGKRTKDAVKKVKRGKAGVKTKLVAQHGVAKARNEPKFNTKERHVAKVIVNRLLKKLEKQ